MINSDYVSIQLKLKGESNHDEEMKHYDVPSKIEPYVEATTGEVGGWIESRFGDSIKGGGGPSRN